MVTARTHEVESLLALLDTIDVELGGAWVVLQEVESELQSAIREHPAVDRVIEDGLLPLSHARNLALHALFTAIEHEGLSLPTFVGFPDADGTYAPGALAAVAAAMDHGADVVAGRYGPTVEGIDTDRFPATEAVLDWGLVRSRATSVTLFVSGRVARTIGYVMPYLGLGTPWPAGEDVEYALRALRRGFNGVYVPDAVTLHPYGTEFDPARRPVRYLLVAVYPPPGSSTVVRSMRRLTARTAPTPAAPTSADPVNSDSGISAKAPAAEPVHTGFGVKDELGAALRGVNPAVVRRLRAFAAAPPDQQWHLVVRDGRTGAPPQK